MYKLLFTLIAISFSAGINAQQYYHVNNCIAVTSILALRGDSLIIDCDTVYLLNRKTFSIYQNAYDRLKNRDLNTRQVFTTYESMVELQGRRIEQQDLEYNRLKLQFDSLAFTSGSFIDQTGNRLEEVTTILNTVNGNLQAASLQIKETQQMLVNERKNKLQTSIIWGLGGFAIGIVTCLLIK
ncbi:MAG: hypothetical protein HC830_12155 [Bacteroidetes bacterium]|nr:hypothetical protein [Bacteroidota bacterium]